MTLQLISDYLQDLENIRFNFLPKENAIYLVCDSLKSTDPNDKSTLEVRLEDEEVIILSSRNTNKNIYIEFTCIDTFKSYLQKF